MEKNYLILGFGVTGKALARFFAARGKSYYVADDGMRVDVADGYFAGQVSVAGDVLKCGDDQVNPLAIEAFLPSPGISPGHPVSGWAERNGIPFLSELDLASSQLKGELIGVTGTNGKSTTVKLITALLEDAGCPAGLYGNIGSPLIEAVDASPKSYYIIEESSYQLEQLQTLKHRYAVCLNVTEDHLDRYSGMPEYAAAKARILDRMDANGVFIYNADDVWCAKMAGSAAEVIKLPYSLVNRPERGGYCEGHTLVIRLKAGEFRFDSLRCSLKGLHNIENMLAALLVVLSINSEAAAVESYRKTLENFHGLPHRVEKIHSQDGIDFYDDSKGTNVGAVVMSLAGFEGNVILIAGGRDKQGDYAPLKGLVRAKVKEMILIGEAANKMHEVFKQDTRVILARNMQEAVGIAKRDARAGDTVLLSPACSSFDQYRDYKARGLDFQKWVKSA